ncbi:hypothetical protein ON010_g5982 [Phytophthora cinnamomi]|nr:hypothetical protein ON010_g5982 [Phytophthora cinnamomi]
MSTRSTLNGRCDLTSQGEAIKSNIIGAIENQSEQHRRLTLSVHPLSPETLDASFSRARNEYGVVELLRSVQLHSAAQLRLPVDTGSAPHSGEHHSTQEAPDITITNLRMQCSRLIRDRGDFAIPTMTLERARTKLKLHIDGHDDDQQEGRRHPGKRQLRPLGVRYAGEAGEEEAVGARTTGVTGLHAQVAASHL